MKHPRRTKKSFWKNKKSFGSEHERIKMKHCCIKEKNRNSIVRSLFVNMNMKMNEKCAGQETIKKTEIGKIVWAEFQRKMWPGIIVPGSSCGVQDAMADHVWVLWFKENCISQVQKQKVYPFIEKFNSFCSTSSSKKYQSRVYKALMYLSDRVEPKLYKSSQLWLLAKSGLFSTTQLDLSLPESVVKWMNKVKKKNTYLIECKMKLEKASKKVIAGIRRIESICISCNSDKVSIVTQHPLFNGGLCQPCHDTLSERLYATCTAGNYIFCAICSKPGDFLCSNQECNRKYCKECLKMYISPETPNEVKEKDHWHCFFCQSLKKGLISPKEDWERNILEFFQVQRENTSVSQSCYRKKNKIRVLSLFDGIGTAMFVLQELNLSISNYFASEVDRDGRNVCSMHNPGRVIHLGCVKKIDKEAIVGMGPIDLLIGGSPCNDLSVANPFKKGLFDPKGTGPLFFEYLRIKNLIKKCNKKQDLFWIFENVVSMLKISKEKISHYLECEPVLIDAKYFTPQCRARYFWGNLPGMTKTAYTQYIEKRPMLNSFLTQGLNRKALVNTINTVTCQKNSLKQPNHTFPVMMNGVRDILWITEIEKIFGFPPHYTDVGNASLRKRQELLGKSWSVPVMKVILMPLRDFFRKDA